jgi:hypothetical protein
MADISASEWFIQHFGERSLAVMQALVEAGRATHERGLDAKQGSGLGSNDAYGTVWLVLPEEVCGRLISVLPGLELVHPHRSRYKLPSFNGRVILPVRVSDASAGADNLRLRVSNMRKRIFELETRTVDEPLDFGADFQFENEDDEFVLDDLRDANGIILVAYEMSARAGLQHVWSGEAVLADDGHVNWLYCEELPIHSFTSSATLTLIDDDAPRFDDAPIPGSGLELRDIEESLEKEEQNPDRESEADNGTEDGDDR